MITDIYIVWFSYQINSRSLYAHADRSGTIIGMSAKQLADILKRVQLDSFFRSIGIPPQEYPHVQTSHTACWIQRIIIYVA